MATVINIKNIDAGYQSIISNGRHSILGDEPIQSKGTDLGMSPSELVLAGLAMCKAATVRHIARKKGWMIGDVNARLEQVVRKIEDKLVPHISVSISIEGDLADEMKSELLLQADGCYIHRLLESDWVIESSIAPPLKEAI
jgi:putative redox protein